VQSLKKEASYICTVKKESLLEAFVQLGVVMRHFGLSRPWKNFELGITEAEFDHFNELIGYVKHNNGWFSEDMVRKALFNLGEALTLDDLESWSKKYAFTDEPKSVAVIMAGNIPLVGFHDFMCVLLSGNSIIAKMSSDDDKLFPLITDFLICFEPKLKGRISFSDRKLQGFDAVIATGSNSSYLHFEQYFSKYPHVFRKNRTSVAVLAGTESDDELKALSKDIFEFYGRGCRSVSHLLLPKGFEINRVFENIVHQGEVINNKKYGNNYDYNKAIHLMNQENLLDNNFVLLKETKDLTSPLGMLYYHFYENEAEIASYFESHKESIQCRVGLDGLPFGTAQCPALGDYADQFDTMTWLNTL
tara:strand:+ start:10012 stop:11094 length:1083 start_codon:yes stop_codon:yes gene_type:complete